LPLIWEMANGKFSPIGSGGGYHGDTDPRLLMAGVAGGELGVKVCFASLMEPPEPGLEVAHDKVVLTVRAIQGRCVDYSVIISPGSGGVALDFLAGPEGARIQAERRNDAL